MGAKPRTIIGKYLFGNVVQSVPVIATLNAADAILTLAGARASSACGIQPTEAAEWGTTFSRAIADAGAGDLVDGAVPRSRRSCSLVHRP